MKEASELEGKMTMRPADEERGGGVRRGLVATVLVVVIVLATFWFVVRTQWFRTGAEDHLEKMLGTAVSVESTRIGWPYVVVLEGVSSAHADEQDHWWFKAEEVRIGLGLRPLWRVRVTRAQLHAVPDRDDAVCPELFNRLADADLRDIDRVSELVSRLREHMSLNVRDSRMTWTDRRGHPAGFARGVNFQVAPVGLPLRRMYYHYLSVLDFRAPRGGGVHDSVREWLSSDALENVELPARGTRRDVPAVKRELDRTDRALDRMDLPPPPDLPMPLIKGAKRRSR